MVGYWKQYEFDRAFQSMMEQNHENANLVID